MPAIPFGPPPPPVEEEEEEEPRELDELEEPDEEELEPLDDDEDELDEEEEEEEEDEEDDDEDDEELDELDADELELLDALELELDGRPKLTPGPAGVSLSLHPARTLPAAKAAAPPVSMRKNARRLRFSGLSGCTDSDGSAVFRSVSLKMRKLPPVAKQAARHRGSTARSCESPRRQ